MSDWDDFVSDFDFICEEDLPDDYRPNPQDGSEVNEKFLAWVNSEESRFWMEEYRFWMDVESVSECSDVFLAQRDMPLTPSVLEQARFLYDKGFHVIPVPSMTAGSGNGKRPFGSTGIVSHTRLHRPLFALLFADANLAVMPGRLSQNLFILDCDTEETYARIGKHLQERGIAAWVTRSSRGGHYWLLCQDGIVANGKLAKGMDVKGEHGYVLCPPSRHPSGYQYQWVARPGDLPPTVSLSQLDLPGLQLASKKQRSGLPPVAHSVLVEKNTKKYASHSEAEYAAILSLLGANYSPESIVELFELYNPPHFAARGSSWLWNDIQRAWEWKASQNISRSTSSRVDIYRHWAENRPWLGRAGETDKKVYLALCERARRENPSRFRASLREVADAVNSTKVTVQRSLTRLVQQERIFHSGNDAGSGASCYGLADLPADWNDGQDYPTDISPFCGSSGILLSAHDAWHHNALKKTGYSIWFTLQRNGALTAEELAGKTGRCLRTVRRSLQLLAENGLVLANKKTFEALELDQATLDVIAGKYQTRGRSEQRRQGHKDERAIRASNQMLQQIQAWQRKHPKLDSQNGNSLTIHPVEKDANSVASNIGYPSRGHSEAMRYEEPIYLETAYRENEIPWEEAA